MVLQLLLSERGTMRQELKKFLLDPLRLEIGAVIASGASGEVRRGKYDGFDVAVKVLRGSSSTGAGAGGREEGHGVASRGNGCPRMLAEFRREVRAHTTDALMLCAIKTFPAGIV